MDMWMLLLVASIVFLILEMFTPTLFFINLAVAAAISAIFAYLGFSYLVVTFVFLIVSIVAIWFVRPILLKQINEKKQSTGLDDKYIGKVAKVVKEVSKTDGRVAIYGEEWQAVTEGGNIPTGAEVKILSNDSIIFKVEKI